MGGWWANPIQTLSQGHFFKFSKLVQELTRSYPVVDPYPELDNTSILLKMWFIQAVPKKIRISVQQAIGGIRSEVKTKVG